MLVACRLAGLSALEAYYAAVRVSAQCRPALCARATPPRFAKRGRASCATGAANETIASWRSTAWRQGRTPDFEVENLIPLGIGGADDDRNLWPEPRRSIEPTWNAEAKDRLE
jgi:hypothetical protein